MATKTPTYLIVGGCGFLGHHIVKQLAEDSSVNVAVLDLRTDRNRLAGVSYYDGDITSPESVNVVLEKTKADVLIHTVSPTAIQENKPLFDKVNIQGTKNLLACAGKSGHIKAFVFTSSASVVQDGVTSLAYADETWPVKYYPEQPHYYSHTKAVAEAEVLAANRKYGSMLTCAIRPSGIFGEGDVQAVPPILDILKEGKQNWQIGNNTNLFDWSYVGNVAHAHILAAKALLQTHGMSIQPLDHEKVDGEIFFVTNDEPWPFWDFMRACWTAAGWKGSTKDVKVIPRPLAVVLAIFLEWLYWIVSLGTKQPIFQLNRIQYATMDRSFNISKAKNRLGYRPIVPMQEGVKRAVNAIQEQRKQEAEAHRAFKAKVELEKEK